MAIPKTLYCIACGDNWLQSTRYNSHYMIYRSRKNAEKALEKLKRRHTISTSIVDKLCIVEYNVKE